MKSIQLRWKGKETFCTLSVHSSSGKGCRFSPWKVENSPNMTGGQSGAAFRTLMCRNKSQTWLGLSRDVGPQPEWGGRGPRRGGSGSFVGTTALLPLALCLDRPCSTSFHLWKPVHPDVTPPPLSAQPENWINSRLPSTRTQLLCVRHKPEARSQPPTVWPGAPVTECFRENKTRARELSLKCHKHGIEDKSLH